MRGNGGKECADGGAIAKIGHKAVPNAMILRQYRREFGFGFSFSAAVEGKRPAFARQTRSNRSANPPHPRRNERELHLLCLIIRMPIDSAASAIASLTMLTSTRATRLSCTNSVSAM